MSAKLVKIMPLGVAPTPCQSSLLSPSLCIFSFLHVICCLVLAMSSLLMLLIKSLHCLDDFYCLLDPISCPGPPLMFLLLDFSQLPREKCLCACVCLAFRHALWPVQVFSLLIIMERQSKFI